MKPDLVTEVTVSVSERMGGEWKKQRLGSH